MPPHPARPPRLTSRLLNSRIVARSRRWARDDAAQGGAARGSAAQGGAAQGGAATAAAAKANAVKADAVRHAEQGAETGSSEATLESQPAQRTPKGKTGDSPNRTPARKRKGKGKRKIPVEVRAKISRALKGRKKPAEVRAKLSRALRGHPVSAATRAKLSQAFKGRKRLAKTRAKISRTLKGHPVPAETRGKISRTLSQKYRGEQCTGYKHGAYATPTRPVETIDDIIADLGTKQAQLSGLLDHYLKSDEPVSQYLLTLFSLHSQNAGKLARLLEWKERKNPEDEMASAINQALDELAKENGWPV